MVFAKLQQHWQLIGMEPSHHPRQLVKVLFNKTHSQKYPTLERSQYSKISPLDRGGKEG
jgi:hypothetical protein